MNLIQLWGFSSRATTGNHRGPSSYYLIIPAEQPRSSLSTQCSSGLTSIEYSFLDSRQEPPHATTEDRGATVQLSQQENLELREHSMAFRIHVHLIQFLGFSSRATTGKHRGPSSYYPIIPAEKPRSSVSTQCSSGLTSISYSF